MKHGGVMVIALMLPAAAVAHGVRIEIDQGRAVIVTLTHDDGTPLALAEAVIRAPGDDVPWLGSRTDRQGRIAFLPDRPGEWHVTVATADGHGAEVTVPVGADLVVPATAARPPNRAQKVLTGVAILLVVFAALALYIRRR